MSNGSRYALLHTFRSLFEGQKYSHRISSLGDKVASCVYEDLLRLGKSEKLLHRVQADERVVNLQNATVGVTRRRGDGTFGELVPGTEAIRFADFVVARGKIATIEIGAETKILAKAMIKQIDRVISDLRRQVEHFKYRNPAVICIALVGVNYAERYTSYEGRRKFATDGRVYKHPIQEAEEAVRRLLDKVRPEYDEFLGLPFRASNVRPFPFEWVDERRLTEEYAALLTRVSREYDRRFP
jgi:hypothetical protein